MRHGNKLRPRVLFCSCGHDEKHDHKTQNAQGQSPCTFPGCECPDMLPDLGLSNDMAEEAAEKAYENRMEDMRYGRDRD
jgi:hypothetical protein